MKDVASAAGVALKTVSRVVNGEPGVHPATAERVRAAIHRLGYSRNESARVLRRGRTATIGLVIEDVADPFYSGLSRAVEEVVIDHGCLLLSGSSGEQPGRERELVETFCARRVDGLIVVPAGEDHTYLRSELEAGTPVVFADRPPGAGLDVDTVLADNVSGAGQAVRHLLGHGHSRIAFLGDDPAIFTAAQRLQGYRAALGGLYDERLVSMRPPSLEAVRADLAGMLALDEPPTAVFAGNGRYTVTVLRALAGRRLALVGFDDFELADLLQPGVTVVAQDPSWMGRVAAELLFRRLRGDVGPSEHIELPVRLIPRGSGEIAAHP
ncbi:LacI family transcriptional regulator [Nonomuraea sp. KC401]|uniref:LacI family DNA-binding transcriptional regulator n=1 Tax=Nonomuraea sp. KC401 TaxID=1848324 RepID=UPI0010FE1588|nr:MULTISPECIES: LacI family DNA-binding transcriptional regulator [unclassified Nonomuraea]NBE94988.1 substrate-binding domain-containing protein [Nonomuraea sp. K271]TLF53205.1 LacI family transcriptional regulator [Nonomuraea sp. KC401]